MAGLGGVFTEALDDVRLMPAVGRLRGARLLHGYRGSPPCDPAALADALMRRDALIRATPDLLEIDVNPLLVHPEGRGVLALDALLVAEDPRAAGSGSRTCPGTG